MPQPVQVFGGPNTLCRHLQAHRLNQPHQALQVPARIFGAVVVDAVDETAIEKLQFYFASVAVVLNTKKSACC
jgi:hypothetical protein